MPYDSLPLHTRAFIAIVCALTTSIGPFIHGLYELIWVVITSVAYLFVCTEIALYAAARSPIGPYLVIGGAAIMSPIPFLFLSLCVNFSP